MDYNQTLQITHEIFEAFDCNPSLEVGSVFLDISKAFDRIWHNGIIFKLRTNGIDRKLIGLFHFLSVQGGGSKESKGGE